MENFCTQCGAAVQGPCPVCSGQRVIYISAFGLLLIATLMAVIIWVFFQIGRSHL